MENNTPKIITITALIIILPISLGLNVAFAWPPLRAAIAQVWMTSQPSAVGMSSDAQAAYKPDSLPSIPGDFSREETQ